MSRQKRASKSRLRVKSSEASKKKRRERPTLTSALLIPMPTRCAHKICLHSLEKRSYRAESVEGITRERKRKTRERGGASKGKQTAKNKDGTENAHRAAGEGRAKVG